MTRCKDPIIIKGTKFVADFKSLTSSYKEVMDILNDAGLNDSTLYNWKYRADADGYTGVSESAFRKLCEVSGLSYDDYFVKKPDLAPKKTSTPKSHSYRMKNGIKVTTYTKPTTEDPIPESAPVDAPTPVVQSIFKNKISSFRSHMVIYRKLLGLSTSVFVDTYNITNYAKIENGDEPLSISTYFTLSQIFLEEYNCLPVSALKNAFSDLATEYNDIYIQVVYFGDSTKKKKGYRAK